MKKIVIMLCLLAVSLVSSAQVTRSFFNCKLGDRMADVKRIMLGNRKDVIDNGESLSFPTEQAHGRREYVTMFFANDVFYKIEFASEDFSPKFEYFDYFAEKWISRFAEYGIKDVEKPSCSVRPNGIFMKGKEVSDGYTDCCLYLCFAVDQVTKETTFNNHIIYVESKLFDDYR